MTFPLNIIKAVCRKNSDKKLANKNKRPKLKKMLTSDEYLHRMIQMHLKKSEDDSPRKTAIKWEGPNHRN